MLRRLAKRRLLTLKIRWPVRQASTWDPGPICADRPLRGVDAFERGVVWRRAVLTSLSVFRLGGGQNEPGHA